MSGDSLLDIALLLEPGADGLQGAISAAPAIVVHTILHVVVITVDPLDQVGLQKTNKTEKTDVLRLICLAQSLSIHL